MPLKTVRYFASVDRYNFRVDNRPLQDLNDNIAWVYAQFQDLQSQFDSFVTDENLVKLGSDQKLSASVIPVHSVDLLEETTDLKVMTLDERTQLASISPNANVFKVRVGESGVLLDGTVQVEGGRTLRVVHIPTSSSAVKRIRFDTTFPPDKVHEHRQYREVVKVDNGFGRVPNSEEYVAGSLQLFLNGIAMSTFQFSEEVDPVTGKRNCFRLAPSVTLNSARDLLWANYEVKPNWKETTPDPSVLATGRPLVQRWIRDMCLAGTNELAPQAQIDFEIPYGATTVLVPKIWMIDISDMDLKAPYEMFQLFVNGSLVYYGNDWDIVDYNDKTWLRWRYPVLVGDSPDEVATWLNADYVPGDESPGIANMLATFDLQDGWELALYYFGNWPT